MTNQSMTVHESVNGFHVVRVWMRVKATASASQLRELTNVLAGLRHRHELAAGRCDD